MNERERESVCVCVCTCGDEEIMRIAHSTFSILYPLTMRCAHAHTHICMYAFIQLCITHTCQCMERRRLCKSGRKTRRGDLYLCSKHCKISHTSIACPLRLSIECITCTTVLGKCESKVNAYVDGKGMCWIC